MPGLKTSLCCLVILIMAVGSSSALADDDPISNQLGDGTLTLFRPVTNERMTFAYRNASGQYDEKVLAEVARFFRCRLTGEMYPIDPALIELLDAIEDHFGEREIRLISAYRSPLRNGLMRQRGRRVGSKSYHMYGMAADIQVVGIPTYKVRDFAYSLKRGGVGYYRYRHFVHVDVGQLRTWGWRPYASPAGVHAAAQK